MQMVLLVMAALTMANTSSADGSVMVGWAKHYDPGRMEAVLRVRQRQGLIPWGTDYEGLASTTECSNIGKRISAIIRHPRTGVSHTYRLLVVDCSRPGRDRARHIRTGLVCEVDWRTARRAGFAGQGRAPATVIIP